MARNIVPTECMSFNNVGTVLTSLQSGHVISGTCRSEIFCAKSRHQQIVCPYYCTHQVGHTVKIESVTTESFELPNWFP
jgi:hypothetical protein